MNGAQHILLFFAGALLGASNGKYARSKNRVFGLVWTFVLLGFWVLITALAN